MRLVVVVVGRVVGLGVLGMEVGLGVFWFCRDDFGLTFPGTENVIRKLVMFLNCGLQFCMARRVVLKSE